MRAAVLPLVLLFVVACSDEPTRERVVYVPVTSDAGAPEDAARGDAQRDAEEGDAQPSPSVCVADTGGVDGGVTAVCDRAGAFAWVDVSGMRWDCAGASCPRGARCFVNGRTDWPGVCR